MARGVTDSYIRDVDYDVFSTRVENAYKYRRTLAIRAPYKKVRLTPKETTDFYTENNLDPTSVNDCRKAQNCIHAKRESDWLNTQKNREITLEALDNPLQNTATPLAQRTQSEVNATSLRVARLTETDYEKGLVHALPPVTSNADVSQKSVIDPKLLLISSENNTVTYLQGSESILDGEDDSSVNKDSINIIVSALSGTLSAADSEDKATDRDLIRLRLLVNNAVSAQENSDILLLPLDEFIVTFSQINVARNSSICKRSLEEKVPIGNSRDPLLQFKYKCINSSKGCTFTTNLKSKLPRYIAIYNPKKAKRPTLFKCLHEDC